MIWLSANSLIIEWIGAAAERGVLLQHLLPRRREDAVFAGRAGAYLWAEYMLDK